MYARILRWSVCAEVVGFWQVFCDGVRAFFLQASALGDTRAFLHGVKPPRALCAVVLLRRCYPVNATLD